MRRLTCEFSESDLNTIVNAKPFIRRSVIAADLRGFGIIGSEITEVLAT